MEIPDFHNEFVLYTYQYDWTKLGLLRKNHAGYKLKRMQKYVH